MKKRYNFISRLINKITLNSQSNNDSFSYYGHWVELQSGTVDYMSVTIYNTSDRYSGTLVEFQFDFWTMELCFYKPQNKMFHFCKTFCSKITLVNTIQNVILNPI